MTARDLQKYILTYQMTALHDLDASDEMKIKTIVRLHQIAAQAAKAELRLHRLANEADSIMHALGPH